MVSEESTFLEGRIKLMAMGKAQSILIFLIFVMVVFVIFLPSYTQIQDLEQKNQEYGQQITRLQRKNQHLNQEHRLLREDPEYLEKVAREKMGLVKDGEIIYRIESLNKQAVPEME